jgi:carbon storage regulator
MLVLSRKKDESIVINNDIRIVVVEIRGDKVRLGVEAPKEVPVHRQEVFESIARGEPFVESGPATTARGGVVDSIGGDERRGGQAAGGDDPLKLDQRGVADGDSSGAGRGESHR